MAHYLVTNKSILSNEERAVLNHKKIKKNLSNKQIKMIKQKQRI